ncbi:uncharacterized protein DUF4145 [Planifilum fimeticola]|jgi:hypothetical protein|uniref:Uncharacterized protein DUF4145 n=1 Tax=Planifilum fimeticola TaxID=201975 RepID=A0A2T0LJR0_9BACL|nr:DUF4145 domain-containing protein [Planifilum fimeticola]PRX42734.1 uncharacterized protein DUF4145 [Planifilum fimeticola]
MRGAYYPPVFQSKRFHCMFCSVLAEQNWFSINAKNRLWRCVCHHCKNESVWMEINKGEGRILHPDILQGPPPHEEMPEGVKEDYVEALSIVSKSPRGASALLRLALKKLMKELGESGKNMDEDIASLVEKGLPAVVRQALEHYRVIGTESAVPGQLDSRDDRETAMQLFELINFIVEDRITRTKKIEAISQLLPNRV